MHPRHKNKFIGRQRQSKGVAHNKEKRSEIKELLLSDYQTVWSDFDKSDDKDTFIENFSTGKISFTNLKFIFTLSDFHNFSPPVSLVFTTLQLFLQ